jgi:hypothetical protein
LIAGYKFLTVRIYSRKPLNPQDDIIRFKTKTYEKRLMCRINLTAIPGTREKIRIEAMNLLPQ